MANRQPHPVGDTEYGQLVQNIKPLVTQNTPIGWADFLSVTVSTSVVSLGRLRGAFNRAYITVESNPLRFTIDGTLPTATSGHLLEAGDTLTLESVFEVDEFRAIRSGSADATLMVSAGNI